jgi:hypothetical protein
MLEKFLEAAAITLLLKLMLAIGSSPYVTQGTSLPHQIIQLAGIPDAMVSLQFREGESYE